MEISLIKSNELYDTIRGIVRTEIGQAVNPNNLPGTPRILTRAEVAKMFSVSLVCVHSWMNDGLLPFYKMNGKTYFKEDEVLQSMKHVKIKRKH